ncbi:hypothetical protein MJO55_23625 [Mycolicibacterium rufum]|uniref:Uncharacterized protein n=1 Tax=Mycolicibacterium rufum TaxID=318424 RepID=A0A9X3BNQ9_9MYCO|nr:hypothetical protein [Mycolicibacterium rufum]KGI69923.1 hypothetical protein EU78_23550 [Mycolicibacterium rufum]MCV7069445.1 hypothetical protein [Mycolicibacterium rufum]ULP36176.1 hypothetical protein MJO55_23625 [Mycolicibacterium rufum]
MSETKTAYCKVCGHAKEHHDLTVHRDPKKNLVQVREDSEHGHGACRDMSYGDHRCLCAEYQSWT